MNEKANHRKILLIGLDNSGKTSIAQSLQGISNLPSFQNMKPTQGVDLRNINALNSDFAVWDLGGQESFRSEHLENFDQYIRGTNKLIYVFDIQDNDRYDLSIDYFEKILDLVEKKADKNNLEISIFLHKFDPDLKDIRVDLTEEIINNFKERIKERMDKSKIFYQIFMTSIYALFRKIITD
jgi:GTPase SAR1 family protein